MRDLANSHRRDVEFAVGDQVLLRLHPHRQHSVARPLSAKLARRYYGPFEVVERVGNVAYRLRLPDGCRVHDVFHVSLLRPYVPNTTSPPPTSLPDSFVDGQPLSVPLFASRARTILVSGTPQDQWLVHWSDGSPEDTTWEPTSSLRARFPDLRLVDNDASDTGGVDTDHASPTSKTSLPPPHASISSTTHPKLPHLPTSPTSAACQLPHNPILPTSSSTTLPLPHKLPTSSARPRRDVRRPRRLEDYV